MLFLISTAIFLFLNAVPYAMAESESTPDGLLVNEIFNLISDLQSDLENSEREVSEELRSLLNEVDLNETRFLLKNKDLGEQFLVSLSEQLNSDTREPANFQEHSLGERKPLARVGVTTPLGVKYYYFTGDSEKQARIRSLNYIRSGKARGPFVYRPHPDRNGYVKFTSEEAKKAYEHNRELKMEKFSSQVAHILLFLQEEDGEEKTEASDRPQQEQSSSDSYLLPALKNLEKEKVNHEGPYLKELNPELTLIPRECHK